jgi:LmbE family N-acetylglucosaminyl deacetylase
MSSVAVSTHLDDVVFSCFSVLGPETTVVTVLAGVPPADMLGEWDRDGGATSSRSRMIERREEDARALAPTGSTVVHLDFPDSQYWTEDGVAPPTLLQITEVLRPHVEHADRVYVPAGIYNADHKLIRDATLAVRPAAAFYADLPYARHPDLGGFHVPPDANRSGRVRRHVQLDEHSAVAKVEACLCYSTQLRQLTETFGSFVNTRDLGLEVFWLTS